MSKTINVTESTWSKTVMDAEIPVVVDFWAEWCGPCKRLAPELEELAEDYDGKAIVAKVNVDEQRTLGAKFQVLSIPVLMFFKDGEKVDEMIGAHPKADIAKKLDALL